MRKNYTLLVLFVWCQSQGYEVTRIESIKNTPNTYPWVFKYVLIPRGVVRLGNHREINNKPQINTFQPGITTAFCLPPSPRFSVKDHFNQYEFCVLSFSFVHFLVGAFNPKRKNKRSEGRECVKSPNWIFSRQQSQHWLPLGNLGCSFISLLLEGQTVGRGGDAQALHSKLQYRFSILVWWTWKRNCSRDRGGGKKKKRREQYRTRVRVWIRNKRGIGKLVQEGLLFATWWQRCWGTGSRRSLPQFEYWAYVYDRVTRTPTSSF